jgi:hypothetical protein
MASKKKSNEAVVDTALVETTASIRAIKGFNRDLTCRGFQFKEGETYKHDGKVAACEGGFHAITGHPLSVFNYYAPGTSVFHVVELSGETDSDDDQKTAAEIIKVGKQIGLGQLAEEAVKWVMDRANFVDGPVATQDNEAATASGEQGAATASGYQGAATASGYQGAATASGFFGKVRGKEGSALFLTERIADYGNNHGKIIHVWAGIAGQDGIKADTYYRLVDGKPIEVE